MSNDWEHIAEIFEQARKISRSDRPAFLDEACRDKPGIRAELDLMLTHYKEAPVFFENLGKVVTPTREAPSPETDDDPFNLVGSHIAEYTVLKKLGTGGMGIVYQAMDTQLERAMALKFLAPALSHDAEARRRFFVEALAAAALDHPNICTIYRVSQTARGLPYFAMRYYRGETLKKKIARGPLPPDEALHYAFQIARALTHAHALDIVHRDIKPSNVMITELAGEDGAGLVKILDFGLAKMGNLNLTRTGATPGTITYMSPEQIRGEQLDHRTDIWALGVVLYEMLTGAHPFIGDRITVIHHLVLNEDPRSLTERNPALPKDLEGVVMRCMEKDRAHRYASASDLLAALKTFL